MTDTIIEASAEEVEVLAAEPAPSTAVARRERRSEVIRPLDADQLLDSFKAYQELLPRLLDESDYQTAGRDRDGNKKRFVKKSGWRKIAAAFDLDVVRVEEVVERNDAGQPIRAKAIYRAIAPSGRAMDGDGYCSIDEERFKSASGRTKPEHDLPSTAATRAKNRAISDLVGMGEVSAEEVDDSGGVPPYGPGLSADLQADASTALAKLLGGELEVARERWGQIKARLGYMPEAVGLALIVAADLGNGNGNGDAKPAAKAGRRRKPTPGGDPGLVELLEEVVARGLWDQRTRAMQLVGAGATDASSVEAAVASMTTEQRGEVQHLVADLLAGAES